MKKPHAVNKQRNQRQRAFTLVEMMIVLTILVILMGSGIYLLTGVIDDAKVTRADGDLKTIDLALSSYANGNNGRFPTQEQGLQALTVKPDGDNVPKRWRKYLKEEMTDPWGNPYQYRIPAEKSGEDYDIWSLGEDGVESEDDVGNWE